MEPNEHNSFRWRGCRSGRIIDHYVVRLFRVGWHQMHQGGASNVRAGRKLAGGGVFLARARLLVKGRCYIAVSCGPHQCTEVNLY